MARLNCQRNVYWESFDFVDRPSDYLTATDNNLICLFIYMCHCVICQWSQFTVQNLNGKRPRFPTQPHTGVLGSKSKRPHSKRATICFATYLNGYTTLVKTAQREDHYQNGLTKVGQNGHWGRPPKRSHSIWSTWAIGGITTKTTTKPKRPQKENPYLINKTQTATVLVEIMESWVSKYARKYSPIYIILWCNYWRYMWHSPRAFPVQDSLIYITILWFIDVTCGIPGACEIFEMWWQPRMTVTSWKCVKCLYATWTLRGRGGISVRRYFRDLLRLCVNFTRFRPIA